LSSLVGYVNVARNIYFILLVQTVLRKVAPYTTDFVFKFNL